MTKRSMIWTAALVSAGLTVATAPKDAPLRIARLPHKQRRLRYQKRKTSTALRV